MSRVANRNVATIVAISLFASLSAAAAIVFTLTLLGLTLLEAGFVGFLSGFTLGAFIYRERSLTNSFEHFRSDKNNELVRYEKRIQYYYNRSLVCLAYFDAGSLLVDKVSPGFLQLLRIPLSMSVRGKSIVELLHLSSSLQAVVSEVQHENYIQKPYSLELEDAEGNQLNVEVTLEYVKDQHMIEAAFLFKPSPAVQGSEVVDVTSKDLDRFRRGMYRRETRIIELKEEVNGILKEVGKKPRYGFDQKSKNTHFFADKLADKEEAS